MYKNVEHCPNTVHPQNRPTFVGQLVHMRTRARSTQTAHTCSQSILTGRIECAPRVVVVELLFVCPNDKRIGRNAEIVVQHGFCLCIVL